jgi:hypothetical protein
MHPPVASRILLAASVVLFLASLATNAFCLQTAGRLDCRHFGWAVLLLGWLELVAISDVGPFVALPWFANPCLLLAWMLTLARLRRAAGLAFAGIGCLLGASFLLGTSLQISEGGGPSTIVSRGAGYWLWLASLCLAVLGAAALPGRPTWQESSPPLENPRAHAAPGFSGDPDSGQAP